MCPSEQFNQTALMYVGFFSQRKKVRDLLEHVYTDLGEYAFFVKVHFWLLSKHYCKCKVIFAVASFRNSSAQFIKACVVF